MTADPFLYPRGLPLEHGPCGLGCVISGTQTRAAGGEDHIGAVQIRPLAKDSANLDRGIGDHGAGGHVMALLGTPMPNHVATCVFAAAMVTSSSPTLGLAIPSILILSGLCVLGSCRSSPIHTGSWQPLTSGVSVSLRGLCAVDANVVWATGSAGTVLRSIDGGRAFDVRRLPGEASNEVRDVHAFDGSTAFVMACQPARIYRTTDGGVTFDKVLDAGDAAAFFDGLSFFNRACGVVFGDPIDGHFMVYTTEDGGTTWQRVSADRMPPALPGEGGFAASGTCLTVDELGQAWIGTGIAAARVLRSRDEGRSWQVVSTPMSFGASQGIFSLAFRHGGRIGVAVGGDYQPANRSTKHAATTTDGGRTWRLALDGPPRRFRSCAVYVPGRPGTLIAVGPSGTDYSSDDGRRWRALSDIGFHVVSFAPDGTGFAAGSGGRVARFAMAGR